MAVTKLYLAWQSYLINSLLPISVLPCILVFKSHHQPLFIWHLLHGNNLTHIAGNFNTFQSQIIQDPVIIRQFNLDLCCFQNRNLYFNEVHTLLNSPSADRTSSELRWHCDNHKAIVPADDFRIFYIIKLSTCIFCSVQFKLHATITPSYFKT